MEEGYKTTLYVANVESSRIPTLWEIRESICNYLISNGVRVAEEGREKAIPYKGIHISFKVRILSDERKILLSFFPKSEDVSTWGKFSKEAANRTIEFCTLLGKHIPIMVNGISLSFEQEKLSPDDFIDIGEWEVVFPQDRVEKKVFRDINYRDIFDKIPRDNEFIIFSESYKENEEVINKLNRLLGEYGKVENKVRPLSTSRTFVEKADLGENSICIFIDKPEIISEWYTSNKIYFDGNKIPTQFIREETIKKISDLPGVKANILVEMTTKMGKTPLFLRPSEEIVTCDGFLCLSDIRTTSRKLFGVLFSYSKEGKETHGEVHIYDDIDFEVQGPVINVNESHLGLLSERISNLIGRSMKIDIIITREWKQERLNKLIKLLEKRNVQVQRAYYISTRTSRFTDEYITSENKDKMKHPYRIIGKRTAFLRTSTGLRTYANLPQVYIRLVWPVDEEIEEKDLKKILWLVKKRLYRVQERDVLSLPEPIYLFKNLNKMYISEFNQTLWIPLRLLI